MRTVQVPVPESLRRIPLWRFQEYAEIKSPTVTDMIENLMGIDRRVLRSATSRGIDTLAVTLNKLLSKNYPLVQRFEIGGKEFGFIPNLDNASYGEIDDIQATISDTSTTHIAMGILYRPVTQKKKVNGVIRYRIEEYEPGKYDELMKECPLDVVFGANVFFYNLTNDLLNHIPICLTAKMAEAITAERQTSLNDTPEKSGLMLSQAANLFLNGGKLLKQTFTEHTTICHTLSKRLTAKENEVIT